jgi:cyclopropane-fatty-acyl-phospholipid synthase
MHREVILGGTMNPVLRQSRLFKKIGQDSANGSHERNGNHPATNDNGGANGSAPTIGPTSASPPTNGHRQRVAKLERWLLQRALETLGNPPIRIVLWGGEPIACGAQPVTSTLRIHDRATLWRLIFDPQFQFGEAFADRRVEIEGDLVETLVMFNRALLPCNRLSKKAPGLFPTRRKPHRTTLAEAQKNVHHHYDLGNDFYRLWLDEQLLYTCAYFAEPTMSLEEAQVAKMDHVCRKLWLRPGETVIEAGCGWGALALHMAARYGVRVRAFNTSHEQIAYARRRARDEGLADRVEFVEDDWRAIVGQCDAFVSVGMLEHVGPKFYQWLGDVIHRCLKPEGRGLIHSIGRNRPRPLDPWIERRIFPGAYPPALSEVMSVFEPHNFSVLDVENLRLHYAATLRHWLGRFMAARETVIDMFDERFARMWELYLAGSTAAFEAGGLQLFQIVFAPGSNNHVPATREYQYIDR